jgi:hypothetical protein
LKSTVIDESGLLYELAGGLVSVTAKAGGVFVAPETLRV